MIKMARPMSKSLYDWCIENDRQDILELWDYTSNKVSPKDVGYASHKECFFKCPRGLHESEEKIIYVLANGRTELRCNCCNSFGQYLIDNYGENALEKYWDYEKNRNLNPFEIARCSNKIKVWIKCQEDEIHGSYFVNSLIIFSSLSCNPLSHLK